MNITSILLISLTLLYNLTAFKSYRLHRFQLFKSQRLFTDKKDFIETFSTIEKILFTRFSKSVAAEVNQPETKNYGDLINQINSMIFTYKLSDVHDKGKNMLSKLFPPWLLKQYKVMFSRPFPRFSAIMNAVCLL
jgi:hypothetical protein